MFLRTLPTKFRWFCLLAAVALPLLMCGAMRGEETESASLAEQAIAARYEAESLLYEKQQAQQTVNGSKRNIELAQKGLPDVKKAVEKAAQVKQAAEEDLAKKTAVASAAKAKAEQSGDASDKAAADVAEKERLEADRVFRQADTTFKSESGRLERSEQQLKDREQQLAAALKAIPEREAAAKVASTRADALRAQVQQANARYAAAQDPIAVAQKIDEFVDARLKAANIAASPSADDAEFLRRVTLDISGAIPAYEDVVAFLDDTNPNKRSALIDRLLGDATYGRNFSQRFCTVTTENGTSTLQQGRDYFNNWLAESLQLNRRWDRIVTDMLAADGFGYQQPGALFTVAYRMNEQPDPALLVGAAGDFFLGLQIKCAQCHDHPFHEWTQNEFWGMAAMFGRVRLKGQSMNGRELEHLVTDNDVDPKEMVRMNGIKYPDQLPGGKIVIPDPVDPDKTLGTVSAAFLGGQSAQLPEKGNYRRDIAKWITSKENDYFARATANRLWAHFFGRGIVEPIDNLHPDNKPAHPEVLELLAEEFKNSDYDLQYLIRCITLTKAYGRSSKPVNGNEDDKELLSHMKVKPLDSFALVDSLWVALRRAPPDGTRRREAAAIFDTRLPGGDPTKYTHSIPQVLKMMNTSDHVGTNSATVQTVTRSRPTEDAIAHLYLAVLARRPSDAESQQMLTYVQQLGDERQGYADVFWVLLNSAEFLINH
jgi:chemotaxis protein histidine kinase CheA